MIDLLVGRASEPGDWRFFYLQHTFAVDFVPRPNLILNTTYYRYRSKDVPPGIGSADWQNRLRLNLLVGF